MFKRITVLTLVALVGSGLVATPAARAQTTWYVDDDAPNDPGPGDPNVSDPDEDGSADHPFDAIQEGIDAATDGDTMLVLDGTYTGTGNKNLDFHGKAITVRSQNGPDNCIIDCEGDGRGFYFHSGETSASIVDGFTITNGNADQGGGIRCEQLSSPTIANCRITGNTASGSGGGICCNESAPTIKNCAITGNAAGSGGAVSGLWGSSIIINNSTLTGNAATHGGGAVDFFASSPP